MQSQQLLTQSQVFEDEVLPGTESADHPPKEMPERHDHGKNLTGPVRIELFAKSYILRVYDVLARYRFWRNHRLPNAISCYTAEATDQKPYMIGASNNTTAPTIKVIGVPTLAKSVNPYPPSFCTMRLV